MKIITNFKKIFVFTEKFAIDHLEEIAFIFGVRDKLTE